MSRDTTPTSDTSLAQMELVIVGLGYVGITGSACLLSQGHRVTGVDINSEKVAAISNGESPITEPGVSEMLAEGKANDRIAAVTSLPDMSDKDAIIVCVGTPSAVDGSHNMSSILESARQIADKIAVAKRAPGKAKLVVSFRSTFRPGTMEELIEPMFYKSMGQKYQDLVELVYNPEFLREGTAVDDYFNPPKIVIGTRDGQPSRTMKAIHSGVNCLEIFHTQYREAEITKFVDNSWHAAKVVFANEIGRLCAAYNIDSAKVHEIFVADRKLNISPYYTRPGAPFGGSCLPKDVRATQYIASIAGVSCQLLDSIIASNESHKQYQYERVLQALNGGSKILIVGLAFKKGTDDMRDSPNLELAARLVRDGLYVRIYDPDVSASTLMGQNLSYVLDRIPSLSDFLVSYDEAVSSSYDLIVANNQTATDFAFPGEPRVIDMSTATATGTEERP